MCHLTKKHKDRTLGSQSRALELCGIVYDPNAPLPPVSASHRGSTDESQGGSAALDRDDETGEGDESDYEEGEEVPEHYGVKTESVDRDQPMRDAQPTPAPREVSPLPKPVNGSTKQSISSIIDRTPDTPESEPRGALASLPPSESVSQAPTPLPETTVPAKRKYEYSPEKENAEPKEGSAEI